jgi:hypothetical protein
MAAFRMAAAQDFAPRLVDHLIAYYPALSAKLGGRSDVGAFVGRTIDRARGFGIQSMGDVTVLAGLMIQFGENFERSPIREWTLNILAHPALPEYAKTDVIRERHDEQTQGRVLIPV